MIIVTQYTGVHTSSTQSLLYYGMYTHIFTYTDIKVAARYDLNTSTQLQNSKHIKLPLSA